MSRSKARNARANYDDVGHLRGYNSTNVFRYTGGTTCKCAAIDRSLAFKIERYPPCLFDDHTERRTVPNGHEWVEHRFRTTGCNENMSVAIPPTAKDMKGR